MTVPTSVVFPVLAAEVGLGTTPLLQERNRFLDGVERLGNALLDPALIFVGMIAVLTALSGVGAAAGWSAWERRIDTLMLEQAATIDVARRRQQFNAVQRILAENLPVLYFAAPRLHYAHTPRVQGVTPSVLRPPVLWNADSLSVVN